MSVRLGYTPGRLSGQPLFVNAKLDYKATGDGSTNDSAAIQAALNACPQGGVVFLPAGTYRIGAALTVPPFVTLAGTYGERDQIGSGFSRLKPFSSLTGGAVIRLLDQEEGAYAVPNRGVVVRDLTIDGSALGATVASGIKATGFVHGVRLENVGIYSMTSHGVETANYTRIDTSVWHPYSWHASNVQAQTNTGNGFNLLNATDSTYVGCRADHNTGHGWLINGCANSIFTACRAEWNDRGFYFTGAIPIGGGFGALTVNACSTDRNTRDGFYIDTTGGSISLNGIRAERDGRNGNAGGGAYAGLTAVASTSIINVTGLTVTPGVDDDTTGTNSPQYGAAFTGNAYVAVDGASLVQGNTAGWFDGGTNTVLRRAANVIDRSGTMNSPSAITYPPTPTYPHGLPVSGSYIFPVSADGTSTSTRANATECATPFYFPGGTILRIGAEVTTIGDVGSKIRLGIRADGAGVPSATVLLDAGQIAGDSATVQEITLGTPLTLAPGWYWYTATVQSAPTTQPTMRTITRVHPYYHMATGTSAPTAGTTVVGLTQTGVTAALPASWTTSGTAGAMPRLFFKLQ
jgi:hypothetical protein